MHIPSWFAPFAIEAAAAHAGDPRGFRKTRTQKHILVIDADERGRAWYCTQFHEIGWEVDQAGDVPAAISFLDVQHEAVVFAHLSTLPEADGARLRDYLAHHREFPVVTIMTSHRDSSLADKENTVPNSISGVRRSSPL